MCQKPPVTDREEYILGAFLSGPGSPKGPMSEINVTPLVDVMLVLLIIFMVTAPMMAQGVKVALPDAEAEAIDSPEDRLILSVTANKKAYLGKQEIPIERIQDILSTNAKIKKDKEIFLHADHNLPYGFIVKIMAAAQKGGATNIGMVTDPHQVNEPQP